MDKNKNDDMACFVFAMLETQLVGPDDLVELYPIHVL